MKKILSIVLIVIMVACMFVGCEKANTAYDSEKDAVVEVAFADLVQVPGYDYLYYSTTERTVYYLFEKYTNSSYASGFFGPYIRNGHNCEYIDGQIVEIVPTVRIEEPTD